MDFDKIKAHFDGKTVDFLRLTCYESIQRDKNAVEVGSILFCRGKLFLLTSFRARLSIEQGCILYWYSILEITDGGIKQLPAHDFNETDIGDYEIIGTIDVSKLACLNSITKRTENKGGYEVVKKETNVLSVKTYA